MIIVKKEYLNIKLGSRRLTLGELNQRQLEHTKNVFGDKYFETETTKKTVKTKKKVIHLTVNSSVAITSNEFDLMLLDKANVIYKPILQFVSQETDAGIFGLATIVSLDTKQRFFRLRITLSNDGTKDIETGKFGFGTYELPFGLYNYNVYDNISDTNTLITDLKIIHKGMMNVISDQSATRFVEKTHKQNNNVFVSNNLA